MDDCNENPADFAREWLTLPQYCDDRIYALDTKRGHFLLTPAAILTLEAKLSRAREALERAENALSLVCQYSELIATFIIQDEHARANAKASFEKAEAAKSECRLALKEIDSDR